MRSLLWLLPLIVAGCSRSLVDGDFYAPTKVELAVALSEGGEAWVLPLEVEDIDHWTWSWQERFPQMIEARPSAPDGEATVPRAHYAAGPLSPSLPRIAVSEATVDRSFNGKWRAKLRISFRDPRSGVTWTQRVRLDEDASGTWKVDLGPNPLTGLPHHAVVSVRAAADGNSGGSATKEPA